MALLLCDSIGKLIGNACHCLTVPFQQCCSGMCSALTSPFFCYLAVTFSLNLPPVVWGVRSYLAYGDCNTQWMGINALLCATNIIAAMYIVHKMQDDPVFSQPILPTATPVATIVADTGLMTDAKKKDDLTTPYQAVEAQPVTGNSPVRYPTGSRDGAPNSYQRLSQVLCYDMGVALYIVIVVVWIFWQSGGVLKLFGGIGDENCNRVENWMMFSVTLGFLWMTVVCCAFGCSLLCLR
jgi:hypothetical protein